MRYHTIRQLDIANGPGVRISIFVQGCAFNCPGCFNPETRDFSGGKEFTENTIEQLLELAKPEHIAGLSILGGEPMHPQNRKYVLELARIFKSVYPNKTIWLWTGFLWDAIKDDLVESCIDVVVDGQFKEELKDLRLKYKGSSNQRVIDVNTSLEKDEVVLYDR